jgi:hypothetical protein
MNARQTRVGALPPLWVLAATVAIACVCAWAARLRTSESWPLSFAALLWAPWIPIAVPAALYIFDGPLETIVWSIAIGGVLVARLTRARVSDAGIWRDPVQAPWVAAVVFFVCAVAAGAQLQGLLPGGDEPHYLVITQSLLYDGDLKIENNHERGDFFEYVDDPIRPDYLRRGTDGEIYSVHAPGVSALVLPAFAVAGYPGALVFLALASALGVATLWRLAYELAQNATAAWAAAWATGFSATVFLHSFTIFPDPVGAVFVAVVLLVLIRLEVAPAFVTRRQLLLAGGCLALLPWLHTRFALVSVAFGCVFSARLLFRGRSRWLTFVSIPTVSCVAWLLFFYVIYGTPNPSAPYGDSRQASVEFLPTGLAGLAFDQQFGLLANAPIMALALWGVVGLWRTRPRLALELLAVAVPYIAVVAAFGMWWGGWSAPARFLTCLMPLAVPLMTVTWERGTRVLRYAFVALFIVGSLNVLLRVAIEHGALVYNSRDGIDLLLDWASRTVNLPLAFPSIHRVGTEPTLLSASIWLVGAAVALLTLQFVLQRRAIAPGASWAIVSWTFMICACIAMTASWRALHTQPLTPESSQMDFVHRWRPQLRPLAVRLPALRVTSAAAVLGEIQLRSSERARDVRQGRPLLALGRVPAGTYRVVIEGASELDGTLTVSVGATSQSIETWSLHDLRSGDTGLQLHIPTLVHSVTIRGDSRAQQLISQIALRPEQVAFDAGFNRRYALRGARYGRVRAFFLDDALYMEPGGVWTRGDAVAEVVVSGDREGALDIDVTAGPVPTTVEFTAGDGAQRVALAAGEKKALQLSGGLWRVTTAGRFRPKDYDPGNQDARPLGARLEFR